MITINTEKGLITVDSWDDITSRPQFQAELDPKDKKLKEIIGRYIFKEKIRCGLSNCHTPHTKGYVVTTTDGDETNIGKDCGKTYFGVDFEALHRKFDRYVTETENRSILGSFSFQLERIQEKLMHLRKDRRSADWIHKCITQLTTRNSGCPDQVITQLTNMIRTQNNALKINRPASKKEIEAIEAVEGRRIKEPYDIEETIAEISGIAALYPDNDLRKLLVLDLEANLNAFQELDIDQMTYEDLRHWSKWVGTVESTIQKAESVIEQGRRLLTRSNLEPFLKTLRNENDRKQFRQFISKIEQD